MNRILLLLVLLATVVLGCDRRNVSTRIAPSNMIGKFVDDYGIDYDISESTWTMGAEFKLEIIEWNLGEQFLLGQNHADNKHHAGRFTRIDFMPLEQDMRPYEWGFCISAFDAESQSDARNVMIANRDSPKDGCNGHPFSRMKPIENSELNPPK